MYTCICVYYTHTIYIIEKENMVLHPARTFLPRIPCYPGSLWKPSIWVVKMEFATPRMAAAFLLVSLEIGVKRPSEKHTLSSTRTCVQNGGSNQICLAVSRMDSQDPPRTTAAHCPFGFWGSPTCKEGHDEDHEEKPRPAR